ncbi:geranylgeranyl pyrophosphate synthetase [Diaporthe helianthi]|uniref:Geranylgeranyl pyrophosphate synthetase n=1 Tax=Diaporthe helianthi TaxID=158607 RepID=A0A2P5I890_DIAHE|nr:geranylgeranyl pyrophosphate synthetase [Diaporthe helianthi]
MGFRESYGYRPWEDGGRGRGSGGFQRTRGSYQGFSGRPARGNYWPGPSVKPQSAEPALGSLLSTLSQADFAKAARTYESDSVITDCVAVTSYNWLDRTKPTIVVPGKPARWTPLSEPRQLKPDDGEYFRDPNAAHHPKHPMEPAILAVLAQNAHYARENDVVACGSTIGNLLRFIRGEDKQFRFLVELVEGTVFFIRRENTPRELIPDVKGYGHSFPEAYTTWDADVRGSLSHQRVLSYRFGGLRFLARFEGDGYIPAKNGDENDSHARSPEAKETNSTGAVDGLAAMLDRSRVTSVVPPNRSTELTVSSAGKVIDQEFIFDLKTRSIRKKGAAMIEDTFADQLPRLWVSQVPNFILAYHDRGKFEDITVRDARKDVKTWERQHVDVLSRLAALIHHIIELVKSRPDGKLELRHVQVGRLEVREQLADAGDALSDPVKVLWAKERGMAEDLDEDGDFDDDGDAFGWDERSEPDFTACSAGDCGYCGRCSY